MPDPQSIRSVITQHSEHIATILPNYLQRQRWFGGKSREIRSAIPTVTVVLESIVAAFVNVAVTYDDGSSETYQVPMAMMAADVEKTIQPDVPGSIITINGVGILYDATQNHDFRMHLLSMAVKSSSDFGESRVSSAEQSNTSIVYDDLAMLKLYRRLQAGINPDVEISRFLTHEAHFNHIPAYLGHLQAADGSTLAFVQAFAANDGDGWEWIQAQLAVYLSTGCDSFLMQQSIQAIALLGRRTAELHLALATETGDTAFAAEQPTPSALAEDSTRLRSQITTTCEALRINLTKVPAELTERVAQLLSKRKQLVGFADSLATASPYRFGRRIRVHGDYHLGQVLRSNEDFLIVDFEGEPARPLEERRSKQSPLRDVAGMLRSFSYAAAAAVKAAPADMPLAKSFEAAKDWEQKASSAFVSMYRDVMAAVPELLPQQEQMDLLLRTFLIEKALYELLYELNNRPSWLHIPLEGVLALLREAHS